MSLIEESNEHGTSTIAVVGWWLKRVGNQRGRQSHLLAVCVGQVSCVKDKVGGRLMCNDGVQGIPTEEEGERRECTGQ